MGSGTANRKRSDTTFIRIPKVSLGGSGLPGNYSNDVYEVCIPSFEIRLNSGPLVRQGVKLNLIKQGTLFLIAVGDTPIGTLNTKFTKMISYCSSFGISYKGDIVEAKSKYYARFTRIYR